MNTTKGPYPEDDKLVLERIKRPTKKQFSDAWLQLARERVSIKPCRDCGWPVHDGYCCRTCGSETP